MAAVRFLDKDGTFTLDKAENSVICICRWRMKKD